MRFQRRLSPRSEVNLVPMIDVVFQLVIFFMVASTLKTGQAIPLVLPGSTSSEPVVTTKLNIQITSQEKIYYNEKVYDLEGLSRALSVLDSETGKSIVVEGDRKVSFEFMVKVMDVLRLNGFEGMNLKTNKVKE